MAGPGNTASAPVDYAQAGELKIGQVGIANLRIRTLDVAQLESEMRDRVARGPAMFGRAAVIVDFGGLPQVPDAATAQSLLDALRRAGVLPVALAWGSSDNEQLAIQLGLPLLAKFRAQYEPADAQAPVPRAAAAAPAAAASAASATATPATGGARKASTTTARGAADKPGDGAAGVSPGLIQTAPVRSGQQVYADNRDLTVLTAVGAGAEVIADGSIHIYGALRGRALAGARGNMEARIFCREFHAELVAIAGHYKVLEDVPAQLRGKPVQVWLEHEELKIAALEP